MTKTLDINEAIASLPLCERDAFDERCKRYSHKLGLDSETEEVRKAVYVEMYPQISSCNS